MKLYFHRDFEKRYERLTKNEQKRVRERIILFRKDPFHPLLENHPLQGKYQGCRSINIAGDLRAIFIEIRTSEYRFVRVGKHSELYS